MKKGNTKIRMIIFLKIFMFLWSGRVCGQNKVCIYLGSGFENTLVEITADSDVIYLDTVRIDHEIGYSLGGYIEKLRSKDIFISIKVNGIQRFELVVGTKTFRKNTSLIFDFIPASKGLTMSKIWFVIIRNKDIDYY